MKRTLMPLLNTIAKEDFSDSWLNSTINSIKFYYRKIEYINDFEIDWIIRLRQVQVLPQVLSKNEVDRMLRGMDKL